MMNSASLLSDAANNSGDAFILGSSLLVLSSSTIVKNKIALLKGIIMTVFSLWAFYHVYLGFIGQSVLSGGVITFVGIISSNLVDKKIANLSAASYSPSIYYSKINHLLSQGYKFKEIIVFMDITELRNETVCYRLKNDRVLERKTYKECFPQSKTKGKLTYMLGTSKKFACSELVSN